MDYLEIILCILGSILLVVTIILVIKLIISVNRVNALLDDVEDKMKTVNEVFGVIDKFTDSLVLVSDKVVDVLANFIAKFVIKKRKKKEEEEEEF